MLKAEGCQLSGPADAQPACGSVNSSQGLTEMSRQIELEAGSKKDSAGQAGRHWHLRQCILALSTSQEPAVVSSRLLQFRS